MLEEWLRWKALECMGVGGEEEVVVGGRASISFPGHLGTDSRIHRGVLGDESYVILHL